MQLQPEWFYRLSGVALDLLTLASLAGLEWAEPLKALRSGGHKSGRGADLLGSFEGETPLFSSRFSPDTPRSNERTSAGNVASAFALW